MVKGLTAGDRIELKELKRKDDASVYASMILDMGENDTIRISMPTVKGKLIPLPKGGRFDAFFYTGKGIYQAEAVIIERYKSGNIYSMDIILETGLRKYQRRQFYRLEKMIPVKYTPITEEENTSITGTGEIPDELLAPDIYADGMILDISGGGLRFTGDIEISENQKLLVRFKMPEDRSDREFKIPVTTVKAFKIANQSGKYENRVMFENISKESREAIIKSIFEEERRKIKSKN